MKIDLLTLGKTMTTEVEGFSTLHLKGAEQTKLKILRTGSRNLIVVDDSGRQVCTVKMKVLKDGRIGRWTTFRRFKASLNNSAPLYGVFVYRTYPENERIDKSKREMLINALNNCIEKGIGEIEILRYKLSPAEKVLWKALLKYGLKLKLKKYIYNCLVDFYINKKDEVLLRIINSREEINEFSEKLKELTDKGRIVYLLLEEDVLKHSSKLAKKIVEVASGEKIYPNGLMTEELKLDETSPTVKILMMKKRMINPLSGKKAKFIILFKVVGSRREFITMIRMPKKTWSFVKMLSNILASRGYFYDVYTSKFEKIFKKVKKTGKAYFHVCRILEKPLERGEG
ncbi:MAG: hypothetical protein QXO15_06655 [Nitrososphaerota archaeon]